MTDSTNLTTADVVDIKRGERFVMLSAVTPEGMITSHPMTPQQVTDDATVRFMISREGDQADAIRRSPQVNLAFAETGSWLSVAGTAVLVDDPAKAEELWNAELGEYFEQGPTDPALGVLRVEGESAQFWGVRGGPLVAGAKMIAARLPGGETPGESGTVEL